MTEHTERGEGREGATREASVVTDRTDRTERGQGRGGAIEEVLR